jgi:hypothetical protein
MGTGFAAKLFLKKVLFFLPSLAVYARLWPKIEDSSKGPWFRYRQKWSSGSRTTDDERRKR